MVPPALEAQSLNRQAPREEVLPLGDFRCHRGALPKCQASASLGSALGVRTLALRDRCGGLLSWGDPAVAAEHVEPKRAEAGHSTGSGALLGPQGLCLHVRHGRAARPA